MKPQPRGTGCVNCARPDQWGASSGLRAGRPYPGAFTLGVCSLFGVYSVKIINEMDRCTRDAQDLLLSYLDRLPPGRAVVGTSNLQLDLLTERFQTRFQSIKLAAPSTEDIVDLLRRHWPVDRATALRIAVGSGGCVRAALADLESWLDAEGLS